MSGILAALFFVLVFAEAIHVKTAETPVQEDRHKMLCALYTAAFVISGLVWLVQLLLEVF